MHFLLFTPILFYFGGFFLSLSTSIVLLLTIALAIFSWTNPLQNLICIISTQLFLTQVVQFESSFYVIPTLIGSKVYTNTPSGPAFSFLTERVFLYRWFFLSLATPTVQLPIIASAIISQTHPIKIFICLTLTWIVLTPMIRE